jgi:hypothetical protein
MGERMFVLGSVGLRKLLRVNQFIEPAAGQMVFFGIRGCLPVNPEDQRFLPELRLRCVDVNYATPRCTLLQWRPGEGLAAAYPGSTVPHQRYIRTALLSGGAGANRLMTGFYGDYRKGVHRQGTPQAHQAFLENVGRPHQRTADDLLYGSDDRVEFDNPCDNLHAAWSQGLSDGYASAGCQVVVGFPSTPARQGQASTGPWKAFHDAAYQVASQDRFTYVLLDGEHVERVVADPSSAYTARVRFGSRGSLVTTLQGSLQKRGLYEGQVDGDFGSRTLRAVLAFQRASFGAESADGIVGPQSAAALGLTSSWPSL